MSKKRNHGFTLAEMLIVVAIVVILAGVSFIAVQSHQRSMTRLEFDAIAKEIFVAAQNHLTSAESQGYLQNAKYGNPGTVEEDAGKDVFFLVSDDDDSREILKYILPDYAVTVSGSYIIRYQPSSATVLDVFYSLDGKSSLLTVSGTTLGTGDYWTLMGNNPGYRSGGERNRESNFSRGVVGWYGGPDPAEKGKRLKIPTFELINSEKLEVRVSDPNESSNKYTLKLIVIGKTSGAEKYFTLRKNNLPVSTDSRVTTDSPGNYSIVLDDITQAGMHFADLDSNTAAGFIPGENIAVKVVAYSTEELYNVAMSAEKSTNSLFGGLETNRDASNQEVQDTALIRNIRHLENLGKNVSKIDYNQYLANSNYQEPMLEIAKARQTNDLSWNDFATKIGGAVKIYGIGDSTGTQENCYLPATPGSALAYDGQGHKIENIKVDYAGDAGLFGELNAGSSVKNLELIDFEISASTGNAGALVGKAGKDTGTGTADDEQINVENVIAYHGDTSTSKTVTATAGDAGGLIGSASYCTVSKSAAALLVKGSANAGGLIGSAANSSVTACYAGGHTTDGAYSSTAFNVTGGTNANAGGLIGSSIETGITFCYSTCSVSGETAGGLLGYAKASSAAKVSDCYCTGLVKGTTEGAFAGSLSMTDGATVSGQYFEIINEREDSVNGGFTVLPAAGSGSGNLTAFDQDAATYDSFCGAPTTAPTTEWGTKWGEAEPYDKKLTEYYGGKYNLKRLPASLVTGSDFVSTHHGDWPAPEVFVFNSRST